MNVVINPPFTIYLAGQKQWPVFWKNLQILLRETGYCRETRRVYRSVFRRFARQTRLRPCDIKKKDIDEFLYTLGRSWCSAQWLAMNISILRTVFDKCCGQSLLQHRSCPKRPWMLPSILSEQEVQKLLAAVRCPRDALLLSFLYGCGLRPGEVVRLNWGDLDVENGTVQVTGRQIRVPQAIHDVLKVGADTFSAEDRIFHGSGITGHLTTRSLTRILRAAALDAGILRPVTAMTLRHSYAVHQLQNGTNIREVQELLGHRNVITTLKYLRLIPVEITSPADRMNDILPSLPADAAIPPYTEDPSKNRHWFLGWFKSRLLGWFSQSSDPG